MLKLYVPVSCSPACPSSDVSRCGAEMNFNMKNMLSELKKTLSQSDERCAEPEPPLEASSLAFMKPSGATSAVANGERNRAGRRASASGDRDRDADVMQEYALLSPPPLRGRLYSSQPVSGMYERSVSDSALNMANTLARHPFFPFPRTCDLQMPEQDHPAHADNRRQQSHVSYRNTHGCACENHENSPSTAANCGPVVSSAYGSAGMSAHLKASLARMSEGGGTRTNSIGVEHCGQCATESSVRPRVKATPTVGNVFRAPIHFDDSDFEVETGQTAIESHIKALSRTASELKETVSQLRRQVTCLEEMLEDQQANQMDTHHCPYNQPQPNQSQKDSSDIVKIVFESKGTILKRRPDQSHYEALGDLDDRIWLTATDYPYPGSINTLFQICKKQGLWAQTLSSKITARAFSCAGETVHLNWTANGSHYSVRFASQSEEAIPKLERIFQMSGALLQKYSRESKLGRSPPPMPTASTLSRYHLQSMGPPMDKQTANLASNLGGRFCEATDSKTKTPTPNAEELNPPDIMVPCLTSNKAVPVFTFGQAFSQPVFTFGQASSAFSFANSSSNGFTFSMPESTADDETSVQHAFGSNAATSSGAASTTTLVSSSLPVSSPISANAARTARLVTRMRSARSRRVHPRSSATSGSLPSAETNVSNARAEQTEEREVSTFPKYPIELPDADNMKPTEEDESVIFCERADLSQFVPRGSYWLLCCVGDLKVLCHRKTGKSRIVMHFTVDDKPYISHKIENGFKLGLRINDKDVDWTAAKSGTPELYKQFSARFKTAEQASRLHRTLETEIVALHLKAARSE